MNVREALEAGLQARWNLEDLAVYADALIAGGDVRGESIALDLHSEPRPLPIKRNRQRLALLARWLGDNLAARVYDLTRWGSPTCARCGRSAAPRVRSRGGGRCDHAADPHYRETATRADLRPLRSL